MGRFGYYHFFLFGFGQVILEPLKFSLVRGIEGDGVCKREPPKVRAYYQLL